MKAGKQNNTKLGIFVIIGVLLFAFAIFFIGRQKNLFGNNFTLKVYYNQIEGLVIGNNVRFSGITVGVVDDIVIMNDTTVEVTLLLQERVRKFIKTDSKASIGSNGLMGDKVVNIIAGNPGSPIVGRGGTIPAVKPFSFDELIAPLRKTAENAQLISDDLAQISNSIRNGEGTIGRLFTDKEMADDVSSTLKNINDASEKLDENLGAMQKNFLFRRYFKKKKEKEEEKEEEKKEQPKKKK